jgi:peptidylprolyl isomerase
VLRSLALALVLCFGLTACSSEKDEDRPLPAAVPKIVETDGVPTGFKKTSSTPKSVKKTAKYVVRAGNGPKVSATGSVTAHYLGQVYPDGAVFDGSWSRGEPATFPLNGVIPCWKDQLGGVTVGSRVVLMCTAEDAYCDNPMPGGAIKPGDDLMFVVDIINAS